MTDAWELRFGLDPVDPFDAAADDDDDGETNLEESRAGTHPRGFHTRYLAEGATSSFFDTRFAIVNTGDVAARAVFRFMKGDGTEVTHELSIGALARQTVDPKTVAGLEAAEFSTLVEADAPVIVDRTMTWDAGAYGAHAEASVPAPASTWYLAEGATHSGFQLFYLIQNPGSAPVPVEVTYLLPSPAAPIVESYIVGARTRVTIWVNHVPGLAATDVSAVITSTGGAIVVERAMYLDAQGPMLGAGHESAGVTSARGDRGNVSAAGRNDVDPHPHRGREEPVHDLGR
jgi:hypothetical protein